MGTLTLVLLSLTYKLSLYLSLYLCPSRFFFFTLSLVYTEQIPVITNKINQIDIF